MNEEPDTKPQLPKIEEDKNRDAMTALGVMMSACEGVDNKKNKAACHGLLVPLEDGKKDALDVMVNMIKENPDEFAGEVNRFNILVDTALEQVEKEVKAGTYVPG